LVTNQFYKHIRKLNMKAYPLVICFSLFVSVLLPALGNAEDQIDASDPTKIYTYAGGGVKYTDYTNGESMWEIRATGNLGLSDSDMVMFELGYGWHDGWPGYRD